LGEGGLGQLVRDVRKGREGWARQAREVEKVGLGKLGVGVSLVPKKDKAELPLLPSEVEYGSRFAEYLLIEGFKPLKRKDISLRLKRCGFRRVTPTFCKFLDNRSRIMPAAGTNPIFAHTSLFVWELNQKHRMKASLQDLFYFPPFFFLVT
ncbi:unnamed protein product, partial [Arabidopsis lyrata]